MLLKQLNEQILTETPNGKQLRIKLIDGLSDFVVLSVKEAHERGELQQEEVPGVVQHLSGTVLKKLSALQPDIVKATMNKLRNTQ